MPRNAAPHSMHSSRVAVAWSSASMHSGVYVPAISLRSDDPQSALWHVRPVRKTASCSRSDENAFAVSKATAAGALCAAAGTKFGCKATPDLALSGISFRMLEHVLHQEALT